MNGHYAVNLADYHGLVGDSSFHPVKLLFNPVLMVEDNLVTCEGRRWDGEAIRVKQDTPQERWDAIVQIMREGVGKLPTYHRNKFRIYKSKTGKGSWKRI